MATKVYRCATRPGWHIGSDVQFQGGYYTTADKAKQDYVEGHPRFKQGLIEEVASDKVAEKEAPVHAVQDPEPVAPDIPEGINLDEPLASKKKDELERIAAALGVPAGDTRAATLKVVAAKVRDLKEARENIAESNMDLSGDLDDLAKDFSEFDLE